MTPEELQGFADDPVGFIQEVLGISIWSKQMEIAESVRDNVRTAVPSCHAGGRTTIAASIAWWWLLTHPYSNVITTAPTGRQVTEQLWGEIRKAYNNARIPLGGDMLPKNAKVTVDDDWFMIGFSTNNANSFQGWHSPGGNLIIFDEATGVDPTIWKGLKGIMTSERDHFLAIGNPTEASGNFHSLCGRPSVNRIHISAFDVPNVVEGREVIPGLASQEWIDNMQEECGSAYATHPDYVSRVLGKFPDTDDRVVVPLSWFEQAVERWKVIDDMKAWKRKPAILGIDVARGGANRTMIAEGYETVGVRAIHKQPNKSTMDTAGTGIRMARDLDALWVRTDADGVGGGVHDKIEEELPERAVEMRGGGRSELDATKYLNQRAEWYWTLRMRLDPEGPAPLALPDDPGLRAQLTSIRYALTSKGQIKIESKDDMEKRGLKSPDEADAVVYAMAIPSVEEFDVIGHLEAMTS